MKNTALRVLTAFVLLLGVAGCSDTKSLPGKFQLERWEDNKSFYLLGPSILPDHAQGGGAIGGLLIRLAWNEDIIAAERFATFRGDPDGWMIIDVKSGSISGPVSTAQFDAIRGSYHLEVKTATEAWNAL